MNRIENAKKYFEEHPIWSLGILLFIITSAIFSWTNDWFDFKEKFDKQEEVITDLTNRDLFDKIFNLKVDIDTQSARIGNELIRVEKIINYTLEDRSTRCVVVFGTYQTDNNALISDCHFCAPVISLATFRKNEFDKWKLLNLKKEITKHGGWGSLGEIKLEKIGENIFGLILLGGYTQHGENNSFYEILNLEDLNIIFSEQIHADNGGAFNSSSDKFYSYSFKINHEKGNITNQFYPICLKFKDKTGAILDKEKCYEYNYTTREYKLE